MISAHNFKKIFYITVITFLYTLSARVTTIISPRSLTDDLARYLAGWELFINRQTEGNYWVFAAIPEVTQTFHSDRISGVLFGRQAIDCKTTFTISGSQTITPQSCDLLADCFFLPSNYSCKIRTKPQVTNALIDFSFYIGLNEYIRGSYVWVHAPLVYSKWDINWCEFCKNDFILPPKSFHDTNQFVHATDFFIGNQIISNTIIVDALKFSKISLQQLKRFHFAEIQAAFGYNWYESVQKHLGFFLLISCPLGNRPEGKFLFEPLIGNGHLWQIGLGISGHQVLRHCQETEEEIGLYGALDITHLCQGKQSRVFDLHNQPLSRYKFALEQNTNLTSDQFKKVFVPIANITKSTVYIKNAWQLDSALMLTYTKKCWSWLMGFGIYARSPDIIKRCKNILDDTTRQWVLSESLTSWQPMVLKSNDIDLASACTSILNAKIFSHFSHQWLYKKNSIPYIGLGAQVEFGSSLKHLLTQKKNICINTGLSSWTVWIKAGFTFGVDQTE